MDEEGFAEAQPFEAIDADAAPGAAPQFAPKLRFIPESVDLARGKVRGTLFVMPAINHELVEFPANAAALLRRGVSLSFSVDPDITHRTPPPSPAPSPDLSGSATAIPLCDYGHGNVGDANAIWRSLMAPKTCRRMRPETIAVINAVADGVRRGAHAAGSRDRHANFYRRGQALLDALLDASDETWLSVSQTPLHDRDANLRFEVRTGGARSGAEPAFVTGQSLARLESALGTIDAIKYLHSATRIGPVIDPADEDAGAGAGSINSPPIAIERLAGAVNLFQSPYGPDPHDEPLTRPVARTRYVDRAFRGAATNVARRGLNQALALTEEANAALRRGNFEGPRSEREEEDGLHAFHRHQADPGPETRISVALRSALMAVRDRQVREADAQQASAAAAMNVLRERAINPLSAAARTQPRLDAPGRESNPVHPLESSVTDDLKQLPIGFGPALHDRLEALAASFGTAPEHLHQSLGEHLLALRPDGPPDAPAITAEIDGERVTLSPLEVAGELEDWDAVQMRRLFGMLAFPAFARVMKLVADVEFNVADLPKAVRDPLAQPASDPPSPARFYVAAATANDTGPKYWSACQIVKIGNQALFVPAGLDEMLASPGTPLDSPAFRFGTLNLSQRIDSRERYSLSSMDVIARAEQLMNKLETQSNEQRSGAPAGEGDAPSRTVGVAIRDFDRALAVQHEIARGKEQKRREDLLEPVKLYADDLVTGFRVDVAVEPRVPQPSGDAPEGWAWRSLSRRTMTFGHVAVEGGAHLDVERLIRASLESAIGPGATAQQVAALRDRLDQANSRPASRVVRDDKQQPPGQDSAEIVALDTLVQWEGDPLGTTCAAGVSVPEGPPEMDANLDLNLFHELDLPADGSRPPRLEIGRAYRFGLRCTYAGGGGLGVEQARLLYDRRGSGASIPALPANGPIAQPFRFLRHERVAAPALAILDRSPAPRPGDTLATLVVRSDSAAGAPSRAAKRIVHAPGMPMNLAAAHPSPTERREGERTLDGLDMLSGRPAGGLANVMIDPRTGGLPVRVGNRVQFAPQLPEAVPNAPGDPNRPRAEGVFRIESSSPAAFAGRQAHYYPDPAADRLFFQLWTRGDNPLPAPASPLSVPLYDSGFLQRVPWRGSNGRDVKPCGYPFAMPVLVEVDGRARDEASLAFDPAQDTGFLDRDQRFRPLRRHEEPPHGTLTVRRVRVQLRPGDDFDLRCWCGITEDRLRWFDILERATRLLRRPDIDLYRRVAERIAAMPLPEQAETTSLRVVHAVRRPLRPVWPQATDDIAALAAPAACAAPNSPVCPPLALPASGEGLQLLRRTIAEERWAEWLGGTPPNTPDRFDWHNWAALHEIGAATAWLGGTIGVDRKVADNVALEISHRDVRDMPGARLRHVNGRPSFDWAEPQIISFRLYPQPLPAEDLSRIDLLREGLKTRGLFVNLPDSRAYRLRVAPVTTSRFGDSFEVPLEGQSAFSSRGSPTHVWALATSRPDPMSYVDVIPAFVWEEDFRGPSIVHRRMVVRLMWRRPRAGGGIEGSRSEAIGSWYSSGEGERFCLLFRRGGESFRSLGALEDFTTQWGADPIRDSRHRPPWRIPLSAFQGNGHARRVCNLWVPFPGEADEERDAPVRDPAIVPPGPNPFARKMDLLTFEPLYDEEEDAWFVDIDIDPKAADCGEIGAPIMRLGIARYQEHAIASADDPRRDLRVSRPHKVLFALEPSRRVKVTVGRRDASNGMWPVEIEVSGPLATVKGGADKISDPLVRERFAAISRPRFTAQLLRKPTTIADMFGEGGEEIVASTSSDGDAPPEGGLLWRSVIHVARNPWRTPHFVFVREVDVMLSAHADVLVESGPRFMAKVRIRR